MATLQSKKVPHHNCESPTLQTDSSMQPHLVSAQTFYRRLVFVFMRVMLNGNNGVGHGSQCSGLVKDGMTGRREQVYNQYTQDASALSAEVDNMLLPFAVRYLFLLVQLKHSVNVNCTHAVACLSGRSEWVCLCCCSMDLCLRDNGCPSPIVKAVKMPAAGSEFKADATSARLFVLQGYYAEDDSESVLVILCILPLQDKRSG